MSSTEIVLRARPTNAESAKLRVSNRLVDLLGSQSVYYCWDCIRAAEFSFSFVCCL